MARKKQKVRLCSLLAALLLLWSLFPAAHATQPQIAVDDTDYDGTALVRQYTTYIPMRHFLTFLGWDVSWDTNSRSAQAQSNSDTLTVDPFKQYLSVNGAAVDLPVFIQEGRIYLPLRTLCTLLGYSVFWDSSTNSVDVLSSSSGQAWNDDDLYWLSRIINAEAGGESFTGQIAVGNVVLNRVASPEYPDTIYEVVFDRKDAVQFEPVHNGTIYNSPTASSVQAAKLALQGVNVVGSSLFFFNPSLSEGTWIVSNRTYYKTIGCHQFYL